MEALEFLKERKRMCDMYPHCKECPLIGMDCVSVGSIDIVQKWSDEHPEAPTINPIRYGHWIYEENAYVAKCSGCGNLLDMRGLTGGGEANFCPTCGATIHETCINLHLKDIEKA